MLYSWKLPPSKRRTFANSTPATKGTSDSSSRQHSTLNLYLFFFIIMKAISLGLDDASQTHPQTTLILLSDRTAENGNNHIIVHISFEDLKTLTLTLPHTHTTYKKIIGSIISDRSKWTQVKEHPETKDRIHGQST